MHSTRTAYRSLALLGVLVASLVWVTPALSATAPALSKPAAAAKFTEGGSVEFDWTGSLQGDPAALDRSYFKVELSPADDVPADAQAKWTSLANYVITPFGKDVTIAEMGVPDAGSYKWRVCAIGVEDQSLSNSLSQLSGGCSSSRALTSEAAVSDQQGSSELRVENRSTIQNPDTHITRTTTTVEPALPAPNKVVKLPLTPDQEISVDSDKIGAVFGGLGSGSSAVGLGNDGLSISGDDEGGLGGALGALSRGLSSSIPGVPIPFWSLALLLLSLPVAFLWRRSTLGMFDWPGERESGDLVPVGEDSIKDSNQSADVPHNQDPDRGLAA